MKNATPMKAALLCAALLSLSAVQAATKGHSDRMRASGDNTPSLAAQARATYAEDMAHCKGLSGAERTVCVKEAQAVQAEALAAARRGREVGDEVQAQPGDTPDRSEASYNRAMQKCEALAPEAKRTCTSAVNVQFGRY